MIAFACKKCGQRHSRPDSQAGSMVFCDCGQGNRVPWTSTAVPDAVAVPDAEPVPREETCAPCKLPFCKGGVVGIQGGLLCGPCKNFRLASLGRPPRVLP